MKKTVLWVVLVLVAFSPLTTADHLGDERSATFLGSSSFEHDLNEECTDTLAEDECIARIPKGVVTAVCDGGEGTPWTAGLYDGMSAVKFCDVPRGGYVELEFEQLTGAREALGVIYCPVSEPPAIPPWGFPWRLTSDEPLQVRVPEWCDETHREGTELMVIILTADTTEIELYAPVEGEIALRILTEGST